MNTVSGRGVGGGGDTECKIRYARACAAATCTSSSRSLAGQRRGAHRVRLGERPPRRADADRRRGAARVGRADPRRRAVLPVLPADPGRRRACRSRRRRRADARGSRRRPRRHHRPRRTDPRLLRATQSTAAVHRAAALLGEENCSPSSSRRTAGVRAPRSFSTRCSHCAPRAAPSPPSLGRRSSAAGLGRPRRRRRLRRRPERLGGRRRARCNRRLCRRGRRARGGRQEGREGGRRAPSLAMLLSAPEAQRHGKQLELIGEVAGAT